ncbi:MAG: hypothetical protein V3V99_03500 [candidate division Zixibacteria bacterium]
MEINPITSSINTVATMTCIPQNDEAIVEDDLISEDDSGEQSTVTISDSSDGEGQKTKGVLRLLQEGHFKSVSDIRLRINFHEEIQALENQKLIESADAGVTEMINAISTGMTELLESENPEPEISAIIIETVEALGNKLETVSSELINNDEGEIKNLTGTLQTAFDAFIGPYTAEIPEEIPKETQTAKNEQLQPPVSQPDDIEADINEEISTETAVDSSQIILQQFWAALQELFVSELDNLNSQLSSISVLPELSEPSGNGKAYDKFLNIYNDMNTVMEPNLESQLVDASA